MTIDWTFSFVKLKQGDPSILFSCTFRNGRPHVLAMPSKYPEVIAQMKPVMTLLAYIAYFPKKDFTKIKLDTKGSQFAIHYLDKRFLKDNFLGIFSVSEFNADHVLEYWGIEEMLATFVFDYYQEQQQNSPQDLINIHSFYEWLGEEIKSFYLDWKDAKKEYINKSTKVKILANPEHKRPIFEQWWDLQLINEFGAPLTDLISFIDKEAFFFTDESELVNQSLESMSLSALKILIDQQGGWNIRYLKNRLKNEMGYSYIFFAKFQVRDVKYLLVMNSAIYHLKQETCLQMFRGNEFDILELLSDKLSTHTLFFTDQGQLKPQHKQHIHKIILNYVNKIYY